MIFVSIALDGCSGCSRSGLKEIADRRRKTDKDLPKSQESLKNPPIEDFQGQNENSNGSLSDLFQKNKDAVFLVYTSNGDEEFQGTGFFISDNGVAVSNYHVFEGTSKGLETIKLSNGRKLKVSEVLYFDIDNDYIIFKVNVADRVHALDLSSIDPKVGEEVFAIGNPQGLEHTLSSGIISSVRANGKVLQTTVEITHGSSGGPLMNMRGEVVGITTAGLGEANLNFAVNIQSLPLDLYKKKNDLKVLGARNFLPTSNCDQIIHHTYFSLSYCEGHEQAEWVAYKLIPEYFVGVSRTNDFREDPYVRTGSATLDDYRNSGYDRGHLLPAGSMKHNFTAMSETFFLSNISPQRHEFNGGLWKNLEEKVRQWTVNSDSIFVVSGGVLRNGLEKISGTKVSIPKHFYKVIVQFRSGSIEGIGFIMENRKLSGNVINYAVTIDEIEKVTGIDFFSFFPKDVENRMESHLNLPHWN